MNIIKDNLLRSAAVLFAISAVIDIFVYFTSGLSFKDMMTLNDTGIFLRTFDAQPILSVAGILFGFAGAGILFYHIIKR